MSSSSPYRLRRPAPNPSLMNAYGTGTLGTNSFTYTTPYKSPAKRGMLSRAVRTHPSTTETVSSMESLEEATVHTHESKSSSGSTPSLIQQVAPSLAIIRKRAFGLESSSGLSSQPSIGYLSEPTYAQRKELYSYTPTTHKRIKPTQIQPSQPPPSSHVAPEAPAPTFQEYLPPFQPLPFPVFSTPSKSKSNPSWTQHHPAFQREEDEEELELPPLPSPSTSSRKSTHRGPSRTQSIASTLTRQPSSVITPTVVQEEPEEETEEETSPLPPPPSSSSSTVPPERKVQLFPSPPHVLTQGKTSTQHIEGTTVKDPLDQLIDGGKWTVIQSQYYRKVPHVRMIYDFASQIRCPSIKEWREIWLMPWSGAYKIKFREVFDTPETLHRVWSVDHFNEYLQCFYTLPFIKTLLLEVDLLNKVVRHFGSKPFTIYEFMKASQKDPTFIAIVEQSWNPQLNVANARWKQQIFEENRNYLVLALLENRRKLRKTVSYVTVDDLIAT